MRIQNLTIIFIIIILPISLVLSLYVKNQINVVNKQTQYDTILNTATSDAVKAFELNTINNSKYSVADSTRRDLKASINTFFTTLSSSMGVSGYNNEAMQAYIPAIAYTMYDGFYIYSPVGYKDSSNQQQYKHYIRPYVYYAIRYVDVTNDIVINYTLDNYIAIYGTINGTYISKAGYFIDNSVELIGVTIPNSFNDYNIGDDEKVYVKNNVNPILDLNNTQVKVEGYEIEDLDAKKYWIKAKIFTEWIKKCEIYNITKLHNARKIGSDTNYGEFQYKGNTPIFSSYNTFDTHRKDVIKLVIQDNLNSAIASYSNQSVYNFKMPKLKDTEWDLAESNVTMVAFMQGIPLGSKYYNGYSIVSCPENNEYTSIEDIYYIDKNNSDSYYHRIDCNKIIDTSNLEGHASVDFERKINEDFSHEEIAPENKYIYKFENQKDACYHCIINANYDTAGMDDNRTKAKFEAIGRVREQQYKRGDQLNYVF